MTTPVKQQSTSNFGLPQGHLFVVATVNLVMAAQACRVAPETPTPKHDRKPVLSANQGPPKRIGVGHPNRDKS